ncbi:MAG TPA: EAL domain-containing protein [Gaiellales bacterium]|nr:EAL domain-containing protein [Gaiellales bacterium]
MQRRRPPSRGDQTRALVAAGRLAAIPVPRIVADPPPAHLSDAGYRSIAESAFELLMVADADRVVRWANDAFQRVLSYPAGSLVGRDFLTLVHPDDTPELATTIARLSGVKGGLGDAGFRIRAGDGSWRTMETSATNLLDDPAINGFVVSLRDVTEQRAVAQALRGTEARYSDLFGRATDVVYTADLDGTFTSVNPATERMTGYTQAELLAMSFLELVAPEDLERARRILEDRIGGGSDDPVDIQLMVKGGRRVFAQVTARVVRVDGRPSHVEGIVRNVTERRNLEHRLRHEGLHDALTGLPNRVLVNDRLAQALARTARDRSQLVAMLLDVDDFKIVNDSLGHDAGDELLVALAGRLTANLRAGETIARLGGDEFAVVAEGVRTHGDILALGRRILSAFADPFVIAGTERRVTGSLGIARAGGESATTDLLRDADTAMYRAKANGKGGFEVFDEALRAQFLRRLAVGEALESALRDGALDVHYQPIVSLVDNRVLAVEALVRWLHPQWGWVQPSEFIPLAEENGLIVPLGRYVLAEAARRAAEWRRQAPAALPLGVFVNVSARELAVPGYAAFVRATLAEHGLDSSRIALELTERILVDEHDSTIGQTLTELVDAGVSVILDDFGTGYSALASLMHFPLAGLKIDRLFIRPIQDAGDEAPIARAVEGLGRALGMRVIAEGIETTVQLDYLRKLGCEAGQGHLLARPQPADAITMLLAGGCGGRAAADAIAA